MAGVLSGLERERFRFVPVRFAGTTVRIAFLSIVALAVASWSPAPRGAASASVPATGPAATGDLSAIQKSGVLRLLVTGPEHLQRAGDPKRDELALAVAFARKLGLRAVPVVISDRSQLIPALRAGQGDVIVGSLAITPERAEVIAFTRPVRYVAQQVVVPKADRSLKRPADLAGKTVTVRASSSYAATLTRLQARVKGLELKPARETEDTFDLIQKVARGEEAITVADSDILAAALTFEPGVKAAFTLSERDLIAWGVRKENPALKAALDSFLVERALTGSKARSARADLDAIRKRGALRVLTRNSSTTYFLHRGDELGFEYELVREFARTLGVRLEVVIPPSREALAAYLREGKGDLIAAGLAVTPERRQEFAFTAPYNRVSELLVVPAKDRTTRSLADLRGRKIGVRRSSSYYQSLAPLQAQHGFELELRAGGRGNRGHPGGGGGRQARRHGGRLEHHRRRAHLQRRHPRRGADRRDPGDRLDAPEGPAAAQGGRGPVHPADLQGHVLQHHDDQVLQEPAADADRGERGALGQGRTSSRPTTPWSRSTRRCTSSTGGSSRPRCSRSRASTRASGAGPGRWG